MEKEAFFHKFTMFWANFTMFRVKEVSRASSDPERSKFLRIVSGADRRPRPDDHDTAFVARGAGATRLDRKPRPHRLVSVSSRPWTIQTIWYYHHWLKTKA